jgi:hypothetical protein
MNTELSTVIYSAAIWITIIAAYFVAKSHKLFGLGLFIAAFITAIIKTLSGESPLLYKYIITTTASIGIVYAFYTGVTTYAKRKNSRN